MPFQDSPEGQTHSFLDPDWVSDCCGSKMILREFRNWKTTSMICDNCGRPCKPKQLHDIELLKLKNT